MPYRWRHSCLLGRIQNFKWWEYKFISELKKGYVKYEARNVFGVTKSSETVGGGGAVGSGGLENQNLKNIQQTGRFQ